jgi:hypothetical protein
MLQAYYKYVTIYCQLLTLQASGAIISIVCMGIMYLSCILQAKSPVVTAKAREGNR